MRLNKLFHSQSGRSLIEILAVLAIMGILSIAGVWGISYAMERNRENETLDRFSKVVAGARTSRILENLGADTQYDETGNFLPEYEPQSVNMHDVISNIGNDINDDYIIAPLEGPSDNAGTKKKVEIYVQVETPEAFTVHAKNLTYDACMKIVQAQSLGYTFTYESAESTDQWRVPSAVQADELCNRVVNGVDAKGAMYFNPFIRQAVAATPQGTPGTLVMWFGPYACMDGENCAQELCGGAECCCEFSEDGRKVKLKDPAPVNCTVPAGGSCIGCAAPDSKNICVPKSGVSDCNPKCSVSICTGNDNPYYCGNDLCCADKDSCGDGKCIGTPAKCTDPERPDVCGTQCCATNEECVNGKCEPTDTCTGAEKTCLSQTDGSFLGCCSNTETCCGTSCCGTGESCVNDRCEKKTGEVYCAASIYKDSCCVLYKQCAGEVISRAGYTVEICVENGRQKPIIFSYATKQQCLFTTCSSGVNGKVCTACPTGQVSMDDTCVVLDPKVKNELDICMGKTPSGAGICTNSGCPVGQTVCYGSAGQVCCPGGFVCVNGSCISGIPGDGGGDTTKPCSGDMDAEECADAGGDYCDKANPKECCCPPDVCKQVRN